MEGEAHEHTFMSCGLIPLQTHFKKKKKLSLSFFNFGKDEFLKTNMLYKIMYLHFTKGGEKKKENISHSLG